MDFQSTLPYLGNQFSDPDYTLPHTIFVVNVSFNTARYLVPKIITTNGGTNILTAQTKRVLAMINTDASMFGGIRELKAE